MQIPLDDPRGLTRIDHPVQQRDPLTGDIAVRGDQPGQHVLANLAARRLRHRPRHAHGAVVPIALRASVRGRRPDVVPAQLCRLAGGASLLEQLRRARVIGGVNDLAQTLRVDRHRDPGTRRVQPLRDPAEPGREVMRGLGRGPSLAGHDHAERQRDPGFQIGRAGRVAT